mgnify:CR=1 FL=1
MMLALLLSLLLTVPPDTTEVLRGSVVTAYRQPDKIIPAQALQGEKLQQLNALSVADAIRYFSGVQIKDYGGIGGLKIELGSVTIESIATALIIGIIVNVLFNKESRTEKL